MIILNESIEDYHGRDFHTLSKTRINDFRENGPAWWKLRYIDKVIEDKDTEALKRGRALDLMLTESPEAFAAEFAIIHGDAPRRPSKIQINAKKPSPETVAAVEFWSQFEGKEVLDPDDAKILADAVAAVKGSPFADKLAGCDRQVTLRHEFPAWPGTTVQGRPDFLSVDSGIYIDLKQTRDLTNFGRDAIDLGYHIQAAITGAVLAADGIHLKDYYLLAVEWKRGARCRLLRIPSAVITAGWYEAREVIGEIHNRRLANDWHDSPTDADLDIPKWMMAKLGVSA